MPRFLTKAEAAAEEEAIRQEIAMDYLTWAVRIPAGTIVNGAVVALTQDDIDEPVIAELRIDGPPVP